MKFLMEEATQTTPTQIEQELQEFAPLNVIRTETVISRLPIHNLAKKGTITISIVQKNPKGETLLQWEVSPSRNYGEPRQLAYKLDTLVINRRFDDYGRPLPPFLRLGSLRQIGAELGIPNNTAVKTDLAAIELHIDHDGPRAGTLYEHYRTILAEKPLLIWGDLTMEDLEFAFSHLPHRGLAVNVVVASPEEAQSVWKTMSSGSSRALRSSQV
jgi:hypothetical protein